jgi:hypothetical protein
MGGWHSLGISIIITYPSIKRPFYGGVSYESYLVWQIAILYGIYKLKHIESFKITA